ELALPLLRQERDDLAAPVEEQVAIPPDGVDAVRARDPLGVARVPRVLRSLHLLRRRLPRERRQRRPVLRHEAPFVSSSRSLTKPEMVAYAYRCWSVQRDVRALLRRPLVVAPMGGGPSTPELVIAAAEAGALGMLAGAYKTAEVVAAEVAAVRAASDEAFG